MTLLLEAGVRTVRYFKGVEPRVNLKKIAGTKLPINHRPYRCLLAGERRISQERAAKAEIDSMQTFPRSTVLVLSYRRSPGFLL